MMNFVQNVEVSYNGIVNRRTNEHLTTLTKLWTMNYEDLDLPKWYRPKYFVLSEL